MIDISAILSVKEQVNVEAKLADICSSLSLGKSTVDRVIRSLKTKRRLSRSGSDKSVRWIIL